VGCAGFGHRPRFVSCAGGSRTSDCVGAGRWSFCYTAARGSAGAGNANAGNANANGGCDSCDSGCALAGVVCTDRLWGRPTVEPNGATAGSTRSPGDAL
jgi:hypothetical protein